MSFFFPLSFSKSNRTLAPVESTRISNITSHYPPPSTFTESWACIFDRSSPSSQARSNDTHAIEHTCGELCQRGFLIFSSDLLSPPLKKNGDVKVFSSENESFQSTLRVTTCTSSSPLPLAICVPFVPSFLMCSGACNTSLNSGKKKKGTKLSFFFQVGLVSTWTICRVKVRKLHLGSIKLDHRRHTA